MPTAPYDIEPVDGGREADRHPCDRRGRTPKLIDAVSGGWPRILSNLKSLLETGAAILS